MKIGIEQFIKQNAGWDPKYGLGYGRDQVEWLYSCEVRMRADFITNYG